MLLLGRFTEAEACIDQALRRGAAAHRDEAQKTATLQHLLLFLERGGFGEGGLKELLSALERLEVDRPNHKIHPALLARLDLQT